MYLQTRWFARSPIAVACMLTLVTASQARAPLAVRDASAKSGQAALESPMPAAHESKSAGLRFEPNRGQFDPRVRFLCHGGGADVFLSPAESVTVTRTAASPDVFRMRLIGASPDAASEGTGRLDGVTNYLRGNNPAGWVTDVPSYSSVRFGNVFPGIDLTYYERGGTLEYDFIVQRSGDAGSIAFEFDGDRGVSIDQRGDLIVAGASGVARHQRPFVYQVVDGTRRAVPARYVKRGGRISIALGAADPDLPLVIDPGTTYSTYLGGSGRERGGDVAVDAEGSAYVTGWTNSTSFPVMAAIQGAYGGGRCDDPDDPCGDAFITKVDARGTLVFSTYLGGAEDDVGRSIAIDATGNVYLTGYSYSADLRATRGAFQEENRGDDAFVAKLNARGNAILYLTFLGTAGGFEDGACIAVDAAGDVYVAGSTNSQSFPTTPGSFMPDPAPDNNSGFVCKLRTGGLGSRDLIYSSYIGGSLDDNVLGIAVDSGGSASIVGLTLSSDFPVVSALQPNDPDGAGSGDGFVARVSADGSRLVFSTYLGGSLGDICRDVALDQNGNLFLTGHTDSVDFPEEGPLQGIPCSGAGDAFVSVLRADGAGFTYSTHLGGGGGDEAFAIAAGIDGSAYVTGFTKPSPDAPFPTANAFQPQYAGGESDVFVTRINPQGSGVSYSTFLGGAAGENDANDLLTYGIGVDVDGNAIVSGVTKSADFPVGRGAIQPGFGGDSDVFLTKIAVPVEVRWDPPDPDSPLAQPPPRNLTVRADPQGAGEFFACREKPEGAPAASSVWRRADVTAYKIYRSATSPVQIDPGNLFASVPPDQTSVGSGVTPGGSFFTVTACYDDGESAASDEGSGGAGEPTVDATSIVVSGSKLTATGSGFTDQVQVFVDGIAFVQPAKVKKKNTRVQQKGPLITGQTLGQYATPGRAVRLTFRNSTGGVTVVEYQR